MLNDYIRQYKLGKTDAFEKIINILKPGIKRIIFQHNIPGNDKEDLYSLALEQIHDCITERKSLRGGNLKKTIDENDSEIKNKKFLFAAVSFRMMREKRKTMANAQYQYNIPILQENGKPYLDRDNNILNIGINFINNKPTLFSDNKNCKLILNIPESYICNKTRKASIWFNRNPLDCSASFDFMAENEKNDDIVMRDVLEYGAARREFIKESNLIEVNILKDIINKSQYLRDKNKKIINLLLTHSNNSYSLNQVFKKHKKEIEKIKPLLLKLLEVKK